LPKLMVTNAAGNLVPNPNYNCTASCINPFTGLYLGADGKALTISDFQRATVNSAANFSNLGAPSAVVTPRILQLAVRFRW